MVSHGCYVHPEQHVYSGQSHSSRAHVAYVRNLTSIQALHVLIGAEYINTMAGPNTSVGCQTVVFAVITTIVCWVASLPRTFDMMSKLGTASAVFTFIAVVLATIFAGIEDHPAGFLAEPDATSSALPWGNPIVTVIPVTGTTFVAGLNAFLNISYTFIGQITLPSFIAEMREPKDFPKALWACTILEIFVFSIVGAVIYAYTGNQYMTAPAFGSLEPLYKKISFSFMIPTLIFLGCLYASVSARFLFFRLFQNSHHKNEHTLIGWGSWTLILRKQPPEPPMLIVSNTQYSWSLDCRLHHCQRDSVLQLP